MFLDNLLTLSFDILLVKAGNILVRQRGTKIHPGTNVRIDSDDTLFAVAAGIVKFERFGKTRQRVSVYPLDGVVPAHSANGSSNRTHTAESIEVGAVSAGVTETEITDQATNSA